MPTDKLQVSHKQGAGDHGIVPERLLALLEKQLALYRKLKDMAGRQRRLVSEEAPAALLSLLGERQQVLDELNELDASVSPIRKHWDTIKPTLPPKTVGRAQAIFQESRRILKDVISSDQKDTELLDARKTGIREALRTIGTARRAHEAYAPTGSGPSKYIDRTDQES
jgi:hypothetical protein